MEELRALDAEDNHGRLMIKMRTLDVSVIFEEYNSRVLVASFMLYKFRDEYNIDDDLFELSKTIAKAMVDFDFKSIAQYYKQYYKQFLSWRDNDIDQMRRDLRDQMQACTHTMTPPVDIADQTWNQCMTDSIQLMNNTEQKLEIMSKTPPKY